MVVSGTALEVRQIVDAVCRSISLGRTRLSEELFPAHPSVDLIDAIFHPRLRSYAPAAPVTGQHCCHFEIART